MEAELKKTKKTNAEKTGRQKVTGRSGLGIVSHWFLAFWRVFLCFKRMNM